MVKVPKSFHQNFFTTQPNTALAIVARPTKLMRRQMQSANITVE